MHASITYHPPWQLPTREYETTIITCTYPAETTTTTTTVHTPLRIVAALKNVQTRVCNITGFIRTDIYFKGASVPILPLAQNQE